ncbi:hypothetical protein Q4557_07215 [Shewanella sp. 5_MG-2023]|uniref:hypothetical protein n=1 Tax=Shewanella sp. 5_MG-2023 TaxID=3062656 RepID=UPI0026E3BC76|nr:hypothetical protein [Shewanella sp. 5_MG-2023]MDO6639749.1 hypothetical protein [Shewanella sp. 5_MG-2023]
MSINKAKLTETDIITKFNMPASDQLKARLSEVQTTQLHLTSVIVVQACNQ